MVQLGHELCQLLFLNLGQEALLAAGLQRGNLFLQVPDGQPFFAAVVLVCFSSALFDRIGKFFITCNETGPCWPRIASRKTCVVFGWIWLVVLVHPGQLHRCGCFFVCGLPLVLACNWSADVGVLIFLVFDGVVFPCKDLLIFY